MTAAALERATAAACLPPAELTEEEAAEQAAILAEELSAPDDPEPPDELDGLLADPDSGPPDGADAWLSELAWPVREALLDARAAAEREAAGQAREPFPTSFLSHDRGGAGGRGFASGSALDRLEPGAVLFDALDDAWRSGLSGLNDDELAGIVLAWRRCESRGTAGLLAAVGELSRRRAGCGDRQVIEHLDGELAVLLTLTRRSADRLLDFAEGMAALPATAAALAAGRIDRARADVIAYETAMLDRPLAGAVEQLVIEDAPSLTTSGLQARIRRAVLAADPEAARRRKEQAAKDARVELFDERSGTAGLAGRDLPVPAALAADQRIDAAARALKAAGAPATLTQLRAAVFLGLLTSHDPLSFLPDSGPDSEEPHSLGPDGAEPYGLVPDGAEPDDHAPEGADALQLRGSVHLTVPLAAWLGATRSPGEIAGFGPASAETCNELADFIADNPGSRWCLTLTDSGGHAIGHGCARRPPPPRSDGEGIAVWLAALKLTPVQAGVCTHVREAARYRIRDSLDHIVKIRQRTCSNPVCSRPAERCDDDHTVPYDQGGRTCECGLGPACRTHHQAKQARGWQLDQPSPGVLAWKLPHGRTYVVTPGVYPQ